MKPRVAILLSAIALLWSLEVEAQPDAQPKAFYKQDFARSTYGQSPNRRTTNTKRTKGVGGDRNGAQESSHSVLENNSEDLHDATSDDLLESPLAGETSLLMESNEKGTAIERIGVLVNSDKAQHASDTLETLSKMATKYDWRIGAIVVVGNAKNVASTEFMPRLIARGGLLTIRDQLPDRYKAVKKSPTWVVQTEKGEVLLEAVGALAPFFNRRGELVLPEEQKIGSKGALK